MVDIEQDIQKGFNKKKRSKRRVLSGKKLSMAQFLQIRHNDVSHLLSEGLRKNLGEIEDGFDIFIFGGTGSGKSSFSTALVKDLSSLGKVLHLVYEEGLSKSVQKNFERARVTGIAQYEIMDNCSYDDLQYLLSRKKSPKIIIIDSFQYARFTKQQWLTLKDDYVKGKRKKIFIVISQADGRKPRGSVAVDALYDAQIKVFVKGKIAFIKSRYEGEGNYTIHEDGAKAFWGKRYKEMLKKQIF